MTQLSFLAGEFRPAEKVRTEWSIFLDIGTLDGKRFAIERKDNGSYVALVGDQDIDITETEFQYWHSQIAD
jgi:hypothetical protein